jgi:O-antigen/teichoic acid export membrane protein
MCATAVMAGFGFFFWLITARLFTTEEIGLATTLISVMSLIATFSLIGFDAAFVRFLPTAEERNRKINTGFILVGITALILSSIFVFGIHFISPRLSFVQDHPIYGFAFVLACVLNALNVLTDSVFLANRQAVYTLVINALFSMSKMLLPFAFIGWGAIGIFSAAAGAQAIGLLLSLIALAWKFGYRPIFAVDWNVIGSVWRYSAANYFGGILGLLPATFLPIMITNSIGPHQAAYFYIAMMIGNLLYVIPYATARSMFAESSHDENALLTHMKSAIQIMLGILLPSIAVLLLGASLILGVFGAEYAEGSATFLRLLAITGIPVAVYTLYCAIFRVTKDLRSLLVANAIYSGSVLLFSYLFMDMGLYGIGLAWILGNTLAAIGSFFLYRFSHVQNHPTMVIDVTDLEEELPFGKKVSDLLYRIRIVFNAKRDYLRARLLGKKKLVVLSYPEIPNRYFHILYSILNRLGYQITNDPTAKADIVINFHDITFQPVDPVMEELKKKHTVINGNVTDISKERVEKIFTEVFGYSMEVDPRTHTGPYVQKSNQNTTHDGKVFTEPTEPKEGFIYQKLIDNQLGNEVVDIRVPIFGDIIPFVVLRYKDLDNRFDRTTRVHPVPTREQLTNEEVSKIIAFCKAYGLDCGELDVLRDNQDGRIYIVDANNTSGSPRPGRQISNRLFRQYLFGLSDAFERAFAKGK